MYARVPTFKIGAQHLDASVRHFEETSLPQLRKVAGFKGATVLVSREMGVLRVVAFWDTQEALESSFEPTKAVRAQYAEKFGAELVSLEEFEVALQV
jgi:hypothetical protein